MADRKKKEDGAVRDGKSTVPQGENRPQDDDAEALEVCRRERDEYLDGWKRAKADAVNEKKRQQQLLERERAAALARYAEAMLPVLDSIRSALNDAPDGAVRSGIEQVHTQCMQSFEASGIGILDPVGEQFDPHRHQAVGEREVADEKDNDTVVEVMRVGAVCGDTVIRAAMVYVGVYRHLEKEG